MDSCDRSAAAASAFGAGFFTSVEGFTRVFPAAGATSSPAGWLTDAARLEVVEDDDPPAETEVVFEVEAAAVVDREAEVAFGVEVAEVEAEVTFAAGDAPVSAPVRLLAGAAVWLAP